MVLHSWSYPSVATDEPTRLNVDTSRRLGGYGYTPCIIRVLSPGGCVISASSLRTTTAVCIPGSIRWVLPKKFPVIARTAAFAPWLSSGTAAYTCRAQDACGSCQAGASIISTSINHHQELKSPCSAVAGSTSDQAGYSWLWCGTNHQSFDHHHDKISLLRHHGWFLTHTKTIGLTTQRVIYNHHSTTDIKTMNHPTGCEKKCHAE